MTLTNAVDEVCIRRRVSGSTRVRSNLSPMIRAVHDDVHQYVFDAAGERLASAVLVRNPIIQISSLVEIIVPLFREFNCLL